jgi:hypothetical protein
MKLRLTILAGACALLLSACGDDEPTASTQRVQLAVAAPRDLGAVRSAKVEVRGTVRPRNASVLVRGDQARVSGGSWSAEVELEPGVNVIDVLASAGRDRPAMTAVRVRRLVDVEVPDVVGFTAADAQAALDDAHLKAKLQTEGGGFFDELLGGDPRVCQTAPQAGSRVDPGATVVVQLSRRC